MWWGLWAASSPLRFSRRDGKWLLRAGGDVGWMMLDDGKDVVLVFFSPQSDL